MNETAEHLSDLRLLDATGWRLLWIGPLALVAWALIMAGFARMLSESVAVQPEAPIVARLIELPSPAGLQGSSAPHAPAQTQRKAVTAPKPVHIAHPRPHRIVKPKSVFVPPPSEFGTEESKPAAAPAAASGAPKESASGGPASSGGTTGGGGGIGSDNLGAQALYAPPPAIPDDLRDEPYSAVAIAHFSVSYNGAVTVILTTPTENPRLNQVILDALRQWRFAPAKKNGVAISSAFDLKIPITIQ